MKLATTMKLAKWYFDAGSVVKYNGALYATSAAEKAIEKHHASKHDTEIYVYPIVGKEIMDKEIKVPAKAVQFVSPIELMK